MHKSGVQPLIVHVQMIWQLRMEFLSEARFQVNLSLLCLSAKGNSHLVVFISCLRSCKVTMLLAPQELCLKNNTASLACKARPFFLTQALQPESCPAFVLSSRS